MNKVVSGANIGDLRDPAEEAARKLLAEVGGLCKVSILGGFSVAKADCKFSGDVVNTFQLEGQDFVIYEPDSSDS